MRPFVEAIGDARISAGIAGGKIYFAGSAPHKRFDFISIEPYDGRPISADQTVVGDVQRINIHTIGTTYQSGYGVIWEAYFFFRDAMRRAVSFEDYIVSDFTQSPTFVKGTPEDGFKFVFNLPLVKLFR